jgi:hypothetical protein
MNANEAAVRNACQVADSVARARPLIMELDRHAHASPNLIHEMMRFQP